MNISIILAHPNPGSFNHAIAKTATQAARAAGHAGCNDQPVFMDSSSDKTSRLLLSAE
jgi:putative NADPH-quinone reductase